MSLNGTQLATDDSYEEIAATYQCLLIDHLKQVLIENGVSNRDLRRQICQSFAFHQGVFDDQFWFEAEGKRWFPLLGFTQTSPSPVLRTEHLGRVQLRSEAFEFHEYAHGNADWYFDEHNEDASEINTGN
ncbi:MAG: hypothetical protein AAF805_09505 [Planctomycetota bacterium]